MSYALNQTRTHTIDDIYNLPEGRRAELIDGQIYDMTPPNRKHQTIARELFSSINSYINSNGGSCDPFFAPFAVFLNQNDFYLNIAPLVLWNTGLSIRKKIVFLFTILNQRIPETILFPIQ